MLGIAEARMVTHSLLTSKGSSAMLLTSAATMSLEMSGSCLKDPSACFTPGPEVILVVMSDEALPMSICEREMLY